MKVKVTNIDRVDITVDVTGNNLPEDKIILHPKTTQILTIESNQYNTIKSTSGLVVQLAKGV